MKNYSIKKIITPTLLSEKDAAVLSWSEKLSKAFEAQLVLYNAVPPTDQPDNYAAGSGSSSNKLFKSAMMRLLDLGKSLGQAYKVRYVVEASNHWRNLLRQVQDEKADLVVARMPTKGQKTSGPVTAMMYNSPCPMLFVREGMTLDLPSKILVPVRLKDGLEQKLPAIVSVAKACGAIVVFSAFSAKGAPASEKLRLLHLVAKMSDKLNQAGIEVLTETAHGHHFGTAMVQRAELTGAGMIIIAVEPENYLSQLFNKMVGPFFLENAPVPVLSIPLLAPEEATEATSVKVLSVPAARVAMAAA